MCSCRPDRLEMYHQVDELTRNRAGVVQYSISSCPKPSALTSNFRSHVSQTFLPRLLCPLQLSVTLGDSPLCLPTLLSACRVPGTLRITALS